MSESAALMREPELAAEYGKRLKTTLEPLADSLEKLVQSYLVGTPRVDRVSARAKATDRFLQKARKLNKDGSLKYEEPLREIQDQVGARIVTFYNSDVTRIAAEIAKYFSLREVKTHSPESESEFGYFGRHFILNIPKEMYPRPFDVDLMPEVFELQIKTLFQHAWAEAEHDLGYKPGVVLDANEKRRFAFTAAQAWGADEIFEELFSNLTAKAAAK